MTDHISVRPRVFTASPSIAEGEGEASSFPSAEQFKVEQQKQDTGNIALYDHNGLKYTAGGKIYVPDKLRARLLYYYHFGRSGGHQGVNRTLARIGRIFWWKTMRQDVQQYANSCLTCLRRRAPPKELSVGSLITDRPGAVVGIDLVGPVVHDGQKYYLLSMVDHFTKYAEVAVLKDHRAGTVWVAFYCRWIAGWGCPTYLLSDNGSPFSAKEFQRQCASLGIKKIFSTPYHPQGNGVVEAFHQFLNRTTSAYISQTTWALPEIIASVLLAYRSTPHPATGETPHYLMTGSDLVLPHFQDWVEYSSQADWPLAKRFDILAQVRKSCFDDMVRKLAVRRGKDKSPNRVSK